MTDDIIIRLRAYRAHDRTAGALLDEAASRIAALEERAKNYRQLAIEHLRRNGFEPGMWDHWRQQPPPADSTGALCAILDALTQEGVPAWIGDGVSCVHQIVLAQIEARKRAEQEIARLIELYLDNQTILPNGELGLDARDILEENLRLRAALEQSL